MRASPPPSTTPPRSTASPPWRDSSTRRTGDFPVATAAAREVLCLPIFPELTNDEVETVCAAVRDFFAESNG